MNFPLIFAVFLVLALAATSTVDSSSATGDIELRAAKNKKAQNTAKCVKKVKANCKSKTPTCAHVGKANICQRFNNDCKRQILNCKSAKGPIYRPAAKKLCNGMPFNKKLPCGSGVKPTTVKPQPKTTKSATTKAPATTPNEASTTTEAPTTAEVPTTTEAPTTVV